MRSLIVCAFALLLAGAPLGYAAENAGTSREGWTVAPYLWAMQVEGSIGIAGMSVPVDVGLSELAGQVKAGAMGYVRRVEGPNMVYLEGLAILFDDESLDLFRDLPVAAEVVFAEAGYGRRFPLESALPNGGTITVTPYIGLRYALLDVTIESRFRTLTADEEWIDPALGVLVEGPIRGGLSYAFKLDGAGFGLGHAYYSSAAIYLGYQLSRRWTVAAGYRIARFDARPSGGNDLEMDLRGYGPKLGLVWTFDP